MKHLKVYTPTNFRRHLYKLLNDVAVNDTQFEINIKSKRKGRNTHVIVMKEQCYQNLINKLSKYRSLINK